METQEKEAVRHDTGKDCLQAPEAKVEMLIRKPVQMVFEAMVNPEIISHFWFTRSSGYPQEGKTVEWTWNMYQFTIPVFIRKVEANRLFSFEWSSNRQSTRVEMTFEEKGDKGTFVSFTEKGWDQHTENLAHILAGQTEGWAFVMAALKAWLEHNVILTVVADRHPEGFSVVTEEQR